MKFIRPTNEIECNGRIFKPGELRDYDLKPFALHQFPAVRKAVMEYALKFEISVEIHIIR